MDERDSQGMYPSRRPAGGDELPPELRAVAERYAAQPVPRPTPADTARLIARLLAEEPGVALAALAHRQRVLPAVRVARWRLRLLGPWFWIAGVLLLALGAAVTPLIGEASAPLPLIALVPLTAVLGLAHALRTPSGGLRAVEASAPIGFVEVTTGLVLAIVAYDSTLGVAATAVVALARWAPFAPLLVAWLGPLLLLAGISLPIALRWGTVPAMVIGAGPWLALTLVAALQPAGAGALIFALPHDATSVCAHIAAATLGGALFLLTLVRGRTWRSLALPQRV
jgi:hypothetical protein